MELLSRIALEQVGTLHPAAVPCAGLPAWKGRSFIRGGLCLTWPRGTWYNNSTELGGGHLSSVTNRKFSTDGF